MNYIFSIYLALITYSFHIASGSAALHNNHDQHILSQQSKVTIFYDENYNVVQNRNEAEYYATFETDASGRIKGYVHLYNMKNQLMVKYEAQRISKENRIYDVQDGKEFVYDKFGKLRRKTIHENPEKKVFVDYLQTSNRIVYEYDNNEKLMKLTQFVNGLEKILLYFDGNGQIKLAKDNSENFFYHGNPSSGYELTYNEEFKDEKVFNWSPRNTKLGKTYFSNNSYIMQSDNHGGVSDLFNIDFDMNNSDWVITTTFKRIASMEGAGILLGVSDDVNSLNMFLISGDAHFMHYNIFNGFNVSELDEYQFNKNIRPGQNKNTLSIMRLDDMLFVSVNGQKIYQTKFKPIKANNVGFFVDKTGNKIEVQSLIVKQLNTKLPAKFLKFDLK